LLGTAALTLAERRADGGLHPHCGERGEKIQPLGDAFGFCRQLIAGHILGVEQRAFDAVVG
jgi:hypothetical protein